MTRSLRLRLLLWLLAPLTVYLLGAGWLARNGADHTASLIQDNALLASARVMAGDVKWEDGYLHADISPSAIEILSSPYGDQVFFGIREIGGPAIAGTSELQRVPPAAAASVDGATPTWFDTTVRGQPVRAVSVIRPMYDSGQDRRVLVTVGRTQHERDAMAADLWRPQLIHFAEIVAIAVLLVCIGLTVELRPLITLTNDLRGRSPNQLMTLRADKLQSELRPIVDAINQCVESIDRQTAMQRRFIADAAHQLRTPLTLLGAQLQYARRSQDLPTIQTTMSAMHKSNRSLVSLTNQLLLLAQAEAADYGRFEDEVVDLSAIAMTTVESLAALAERRGVALSVRLDAAVPVVGSASLLSILIFNLLDNAIRYAPTHTGQVSLAVLPPQIDGDNDAQSEARPDARPDGRLDGDRASRHGARLEIADNGPGIPTALHERVFEPFFRAPIDPTADGSGLGLAIVREIARAHRADLLLHTLEASSGLVVSVRFRKLKTDDNAR